MRTGEAPVTSEQFLKLEDLQSRDDALRTFQLRHATNFRNEILGLSPTEQGYPRRGSTTIGLAYQTSKRIRALNGIRESVRLVGGAS